MSETDSASVGPPADGGGQPMNGQVTNGQVTSAAAEADTEAAAPSWFEPAVRPADAQTAEWFLRTGRAGLLPDSMTESWDEEAHPVERAVTAANPPWAGERADLAGDSPPPWESGPWGEDLQDRPEARAEAEDARRLGAAPGLGPAGNWQAAAALGTGILPLVVPGIVFGVLGLRQAAVTRTGRIWSLTGIGLSVIWALVLIVLVTSGGQSARACGSAETGVTSAAALVLRDFGSGAPQSALSQDMQNAIAQANSAAATTNQLDVRDALVELTAGLEQAQLDATASPPRGSSARAEVAAGLAAVTAACKG